MARQNIVVGLDIGTVKTVVLVGEVDNNGGVSVIGVGEQPTQGMRKGSIVDIDGVTKTIAMAVEKAGHMSGCRLHTAFVGVSGPHLASMNNKGVVAITNQDKEIGPEDVQRVLQAAKVVNLPQDRKILYVHPRHYTVDGNDGIVDPIGMAGIRLEVETNIISCSGTALQNLLKCITRAGLQEDQLVRAALVSAEAVLMPAERELGCIIVDIGAGTTQFAIFDQGRLWYTSVLPIGGSLITNDIAVGLRTPAEVAEKLKTEYGCVLASLMPDNEMITIPSVGGQDTRQISKKMLAAIIEPRVQEMLGMIRDELKKSGYRGMLPGGMVITGGSAEMDGLAELAAEVMLMPVRIGRPNRIDGISEVTKNSAYATAIGLILYGADRLSMGQVAAAEENMLEGVWTKIKLFFQDFFG